MRSVAAKLVRKFPPVAARDRRIKRLESEARKADGKIRWSEDDRARLQERLNRALRKVETFRDNRDRAEGQRLAVAQEKEDLEEQLHRSQADLKRANERVEKPSFLTQLTAYRELFERRLTDPNPRGIAQWQLPYKLRNSSLAASHGVSTPEIYRVWQDVADINLGDLDVERLVLKSDGGDTGKAVFVLQKTTDGWETLDGSISFVGNTPPSEILDRLADWYSPYFIEEFLEGTSDSVVPEDIKVYTAHGRVMQLLLMQADASGSMDRRTFTRRYLDADGEDLGRVTMMGTLNEKIPVPDNMHSIIDISERLSRAAGVPFVRVDLYNTPKGLVFGELTPTPGGRQRYRREHDMHMGSEWIKAQSRLEQDLAEGRPYGGLFGEKKHTWWYEDMAAPTPVTKQLREKWCG